MLLLYTAVFVSLRFMLQKHKCHPVTQNNGLGFVWFFLVCFVSVWELKRILSILFDVSLEALIIWELLEKARRINMMTLRHGNTGTHTTALFAPGINPVSSPFVKSLHDPLRPRTNPALPRTFWNVLQTQMNRLKGYTTPLSSQKPRSVCISYRRPGYFTSCLKLWKSKTLFRTREDRHRGHHLPASVVFLKFLAILVNSTLLLLCSSFCKTHSSCYLAYHHNLLEWKNQQHHVARDFLKVQKPQYFTDSIHSPDFHHYAHNEWFTGMVTQLALHVMALISPWTFELHLLH